MELNRINNRRDSSPSNSKCGFPKQLRKRLPFLSWMPTYKRADLTADIIAGVTVGLTVVPQSMAYAAIAGLSPEFGLYSSYIGCFLYVFLGSCKQVTIGPTAVMGLLVYETCGIDYPSCAILTGFYAGIFELMMAVLQLGWVVSFISESVVIGFTSGAATTIISSQVKNLLGISGPKGSGFLGYWYAIIRDFSTISLGDCCMGLISFIVLLFLRKLKDYKHSKSPHKKLIEGMCWFISVSRNVIIVVITSCIAYLWSNPPFKLTGHVLGGFPDIGVPLFSLPYTSDVSLNMTITSTSEESRMSFWETWSFIGAGPLIVALIAILQNVAISKAFGSGQSIDATQEMFALGTANVIGSFFSSIPISGSFSRSAVNESSGVRSPLGGSFTGILVLLSLWFLTPSFYYIPKASLAAVIISAVMFMIEFESFPVMWSISKMDAVACLVTYVCSILLGMEYGILTGVATSISVLLIKMLRPQLNPVFFSDDCASAKYICVKPDPGINFPSVDFIRTSIIKLMRKHTEINVFAINFDKWQNFDYTSATALASIAKIFRKENKILIFTNLNRDWENALRKAGLSDILCCSQENLSDYVRKYSVLDMTSFNIDSCAKNKELKVQVDVEHLDEIDTKGNSELLDRHNVPNSYGANKPSMDVVKPLL